MAIPATPVNLSPSGGQSIVVTQDNTLTWQSDGSQAAYYLEYVHNMDGAIPVNTGWVTDSLSRHEFVANTFTNTFEYKWRVKVRNIQGQESLFSDWAVFRAGNPAVLTITFPANDYDQLTAMPVYQHVYNHPNGYQQRQYRYRVFTGTIWDEFDAMTAAQQESMTWDELEQYSEGGVVWDSGIVESDATSVEQPAGYFQIFQYWYKVQVTVWDTCDNEVTSDIRVFGLLIESIPKEPMITAYADPDYGRNVVAINNPLPDPGQVATAYNRLYRRRPGGSWELVQDNIFDGIGYDTTCSSGKDEEYSATAVGTNDIESGRSISAFANCVLKDHWFTNLTTYETVKCSLSVQWGRMQSERGRAEVTGIDSQYPKVLCDATRYYTGSFRAAIVRSNNGTTWTEYVAAIRAVLDSGDTVLYRSPFGDVFKLDISDFQVEIADSRYDQYRYISFTMTEVSETAPFSAYNYDAPGESVIGLWIIDSASGRGMQLDAGVSISGLVSERDRFGAIGFGTSMPSIAYGSKRSYRGGLSGYLVPTSTETAAQLVHKFRELVDGKEKKPFFITTKSGDFLIVDIYGFSFEVFDRFDNARKVAFEFVEVGTREPLTWDEVDALDLTWSEVDLRELTWNDLEMLGLS